MVAVTPRDARMGRFISVLVVFGGGGGGGQAKSATRGQDGISKSIIARTLQCWTLNLASSHGLGSPALPHYVTDSPYHTPRPAFNRPCARSSPHAALDLFQNQPAQRTSSRGAVRTGAGHVQLSPPPPGQYGTMDVTGPIDSPCHTICRAQFVAERSVRYVSRTGPAREMHDHRQNAFRRLTDRSHFPASTPLDVAACSMLQRARMQNKCGHHRWQPIHNDRKAINDKENEE